MPKVRVKKVFFDKVRDEYPRVGKEFDVEDARANVLSMGYKKDIFGSFAYEFELSQCYSGIYDTAAHLLPLGVKRNNQIRKIATGPSVNLSCLSTTFFKIKYQNFE